MGSITEFVSKFNGGARPNLYKVTVNRIAVPELEFLCKAAQIPGRTIGEVQVPYLNRKIAYAGDPSLTDWTITIINDENFKIHDAINTWMNSIQVRDIVSGLSIGYMGQAEVVQLGRGGEELKAFQLFNVWPGDLAAIDLGFDNNDTVEEFTVTLKYSHYEVI